VISGLEVTGPTEAGAVVVLGNSIADGRGSGTDKNNRWPDNLARRLQANERWPAVVAVLNAGIGGNAVLRGGLGPTALDRFERDVLDQRGVRWVIVSEGVNALSGPNLGVLLITHYQRLLNYIVPDFVHVMVQGRIVRSGGKELALELEEKGYDLMRDHAEEPVAA